MSLLAYNCIQRALRQSNSFLSRLNNPLVVFTITVATETNLKLAIIRCKAVFGSLSPCSVHSCLIPSTLEP